MQTQENGARQIRAYAIISKGDTPTVLEGNKYLVPSKSSDKGYTINASGLWSCECKDYQNRKQDCKHILAVRIWLELREKMAGRGISLDAPELKEEADALEALVSLGYSPREAREALAQIPSEIVSVEKKVKEVLKKMGGRK